MAVQRVGELEHLGLCVQYNKPKSKCKTYNKFAEIRNVLMNPPVLYVSGCVAAAVTLFWGKQREKCERCRKLFGALLQSLIATEDAFSPLVFQP